MVGLFTIQLPQIEDVSRFPQIVKFEKINNLDTKKATPKSGKENQNSKTCCFYDLTVIDLNIEFNV